MKPEEQESDQEVVCQEKNDKLSVELLIFFENDR